MDLSIVVLVLFVAISLVTLAVILLVRDLAVSRSTAGGAIEIDSRRLRRTPTAFDQPPATSLIGRIDQAFDRLVLETGYELVPGAAFLLLLASGLAVGGALFVYYNNPLPALGGLLLGMAIPLTVLIVRRNRRIREIREQLPHVIDLMARAVRAGESVDQAIALIGREANEPLRHEFSRCASQLNMGRALSAVMRSMGNRVRIHEMRILASTLMVHRQAGGNLALALDRMSAVIRDRLSYQRQMRASTGAGRTSAVMIATISPAVYILMFAWQPEHFSILWEDPFGRMLLAFAFALEVIGILWVMALLKRT